VLPEGRALALAQWMARHERWVFDRHCMGAVSAVVALGVRSLPLGTARQCLRLALAHDLRAELPRLACPALVVTGGRDTAFAHDAARELVRLLPGAEVAVCPEAGHLHPMSRPERFAEAVARFADGL
jgi:pimeloyl-ACP methyl ester carboxylesterase